jgi:hypothetical protein
MPCWLSSWKLEDVHLLLMDFQIQIRFILTKRRQRSFT